MTEIREDDGTYRAFDDEGEELENSPYDSEKAAKIALNQLKLKDEEEKNDEDEEEEETEETSDAQEDPEPEAEPEDTEETSGMPSMKTILGIGAMATAVFLYGSSGTEKEDPEPESQPQDKHKSRKSAGDMF